MSGVPENAVSALLQAAQAGDQGAPARLLPAVYAELRRLAQAKLAQLPPGQTLQPTALVHEAYLRLLGKADVHFESQQHFFFAAARAMRDILVERARRKAYSKHGGGRQQVELDETLAFTEPPPAAVLALHEALEQLERDDPLKARIVNLRYFTGMSMKETAAVMGLSERTLHRHWRFIKAWLKSRLGEPG